jgi:signal transduction histidine kinase
MTATADRVYRWAVKPLTALKARADAPAMAHPGPRIISGLAFRLLLLTVIFTFAVGALIIVPNAASFHERWLRDRLQAAELASTAVEALPYSMVDDEVAEQLMTIGGVQAVVVGDQGVRRLLLQAPNLPRTPDVIDLRGRGTWARVVEPWRTLFGHPDRSIRVQARPRYRSGDYVEILAPAEPLKQELRSTLVNSLITAVLVAGLAGLMLYAALAVLVLRPLNRVTRSIERFAGDPESDPEPPSARRDEIGQVERELARMQGEVRLALRSRARLAALGEAVAKINHDLRNMLSAAQIASDRMADSADPAVARALPRLERALGRATALTRNVLDYGKTEEPEPQLRRVTLGPAVTAAAQDAGLEHSDIKLVRALPARLAVTADPDQLHRILVNLMRNARQALSDTPEAVSGTRPPRLKVSAEARGNRVHIRLEDNGPGIPPRVEERLFQAFVSGAGREGSGLGLTISRELAEAQGGTLRLVSTGPQGTVFELVLNA